MTDVPSYSMLKDEKTNDVIWMFNLITLIGDDRFFASNDNGIIRITHGFSDFLKGQGIMEAFDEASKLASRDRNTETCLRLTAAQFMILKLKFL